MGINAQPFSFSGTNKTEGGDIKPDRFFQPVWFEGTAPIFLQSLQCLFEGSKQTVFPTWRSF
jgi:hypothetical protein